ncbi:MAG: hypothetical protein ACRDQA_31025 [Nocardioidaceae bacterium]
MRKAALAVLGALTALTIVAGCGSDPDSDADSHAPSSSESIAGALRWVPDTADTRKMVTVNLYDAAWAASGSDRDAQGAVMALSSAVDGAGAAPSQLFVGRRMAPDQMQTVAGYDPVHLDSDVTAGAPPHQFVAATGDFDTGAITKALSKTVGEAATTRKVDDTQVVSWLEDNAMEPGLHDPIQQAGMSGRVAVTDGEIAYARSDADIKAMIVAASGDRQSLADVNSLVSAADALDDAGVYSAMLGTSRYGGVAAALGDKPESPEKMQKHMRRLAASALQPYQAFGIGEAKPDGTPTMIVVLVMGDHEGARANATKLREKVRKGSSLVAQKPWAKLLSNPRIEVHDKVVTAKFAVENPTLWHRIVPEQDSLLATK